MLCADRADDCFMFTSLGLMDAYAPAWFYETHFGNRIIDCPATSEFYLEAFEPALIHSQERSHIPVENVVLIIIPSNKYPISRP